MVGSVGLGLGLRTGSTGINGSGWSERDNSYSDELLAPHSTRNLVNWVFIAHSYMLLPLAKLWRLPDRWSERRTTVRVHPSILQVYLCRPVTLFPFLLLEAEVALRACCFENPCATRRCCPSLTNLVNLTLSPLFPASRQMLHVCQLSYYMISLVEIEKESKKKTSY